MRLSRRVIVLLSLAALEASASDDSDCAEALLSSDADGSGGLDADEFFAFLKSTEGYFDQFDTYSALPFYLRVLHKSLACRCTSLGLGDGCCIGEGAEIPLVGMSDGPESAGFEWRRDEVCEQISYVIDEIVGTPSPIAAPANEISVESTTAATSSTAGVTTSSTEEGTPSPIAAPANETTVESTTAATSSTAGVTTSSTEEGTPSPIAAPANETTVESTTVATSSSNKASTSSTEEPAMASVTIEFFGSVLDYTQTEDLPLFGEETEGDSLPFYRAEDIMANTDNNDVVIQVLNCVGDLARQSLGDFVSTPSKRRIEDKGRRLQMSPIVVKDVGEYSRGFDSNFSE